MSINKYAEQPAVVVTVKADPKAIAARQGKGVNARDPQVIAARRRLQEVHRQATAWRQQNVLNNSK